MKIAVRHIDHGGNDGERDDRVAGAAIEVAVEVCGANTIHVGRYCLDENHAAVLALQLEAAVAEVAARKVSL